MGAEQSTQQGAAAAAGSESSASGGVGESAAAAAAAGAPQPLEQQQDGPALLGGGGGSGKRPKALVIVGPSGVGKGTLISKLTEAAPEQYGFSVSHTTRAPRTGEKHGEHYYFTTKQQFAKEIAEGRFLEYAEVHGNLYGTSVAAVRRVLDQGKVCILDIDVQGARSVRAARLGAIFIFIAPPSLEDLARRLVGRGTETVQQIQKRLNNAKAEINSLNERGLYDYLIINDALEDALAKLKHIAARAAAGLDPEPGQVPETVIIEDAPVPDLELPNLQQEAAPATPTLAAAGAAPAGGAAPPAPSTTATSPTNGSQASTLSGSSASATTNPASSAAGAPADSAAAAGAAQAATAAPPEHPPNGDAATGSILAASHSLLGSTISAAPGASGNSVLEALHPGLERWRGRVALVTGASSGIGWATCEALALAGLRVVAVARRKDRLEELQAHVLSGKLPGVQSSHFLPVVCDVTREAEVATLPRIVAKRWPEAGGVDVLVNNAGMSRSDASLMEGNVDSWVEMLSTNVLGTAMTTRAVVQDMKRRGQWGHIINMVGLSGHRIPDGPQGGGFYCATKAALRTMTEGLRQEARGAQLPLRVSAISPGIVETEFFTVRHNGDVDAARRATSQFPCLQPADVARAILWVLAAPQHVEVDDVVVRPTAQLI